MKSAEISKRSWYRRK